VGYPDASLSAASGRTADGRPPGVRHGGAGPGVCADSDAPPHEGCADEPPACTPARSSAALDRTRSIGTPAHHTGRTGNAGNRDAEPDLRGLDSGAKTGNDRRARSASSRLTRGTGSCQTNSPSSACWFVPILSRKTPPQLDPPSSRATMMTTRRPTLRGRFRTQPPESRAFRPPITMLRWRTRRGGRKMGERSE